MAKKRLADGPVADTAVLAEDDLLSHMPFDHLIVVVMELNRGQWYTKVIDRHTGFSASEGGSGTEPERLVEACWKRLVVQGVTVL